MKEVSHKRLHIVWIHSYEIFRIEKCRDGEYISGFPKLGAREGFGEGTGE
jgi:hypothetical protein